MLNVRERNNVLGALLFWQEEICPHDPAIARPYLPEPNLEPLSTAEVEGLRTRLASAKMRYALYDPAADRLAGRELYPDRPAAEARRGTGLRIVTVAVEQI